MDITTTGTPEQPSAVESQKRNIVRKLYDWVLHWAETPYGTYALFLLAFMESSIFPIPPDALLIALILGVRAKAFKFALNCTIASLLGAILGYGIGYFVWWNEINEFSTVALFFLENVPGFTEHAFFRIQDLYEKWNFWIIFTAGFTPLPYKVFTISAGAFHINLFMFLIASIVGRAGRFFIVALLIWKFGDNIKNFMDKYFNLLAILFTVLLIGGFIVIKYLI